MASTYSTNLAIELIGTGDQAGSWGNTTNTNLGTLIEQAISGYVTQAVSTGTDTTITIPNGATGVARNMYIELTGTGGASTNLIVPANKKLYFIFNNTTGAVTVKVSGQTGVSVPQGKKMVLVSNGTDVVVAENYIADFGSNSATITNLTCTSLTLSNNPTFSGGTANGVLYLNGSKVATSGSALVFDGTNLGIGTASPSDKLHVVGLARINTGTYAAGYGLTFQAISETSRTYQMGMVTGGNFAIYDSTAAAQRVVLDTSGNLGLGVTPSAWSPQKAMQIASYTALADNPQGGGGFGLSSNAYEYSSGAYKYLQSYYAALYRTYAGQHQWFTAPSGTAGNTISFTQAMTLDASGNLGVGITSPNSRLDVVGGTGIRVNEDGASTKVIQVRSNFAGVGPAINVATNDPLLFQTNNTERARITAGGVLCVGTTATNSAECLSLFSSTIASSNVGLLAIRSGKSGDESDCIASFVKFSSTNTTSQVFIRFGVDNYNSGCGQINANGASQAAFGSFSDRRLKDNIVDLASQWDNIKTLRPVEFDYIASEGGGHQLGFIAQEVKEVYPDLVGERKDGMLTISGMGKGESRLIKALQEAMARIEQLEADMAALKASA